MEPHREGVYYVAHYEGQNLAAILTLRHAKCDKNTYKNWLTSRNERLFKAFLIVQHIIELNQYSLGKYING